MENQLGQYLRSARLNVRLTQDAAAKSAGMSRQQLNRIENGTSGTEWETVERLTNVYGCSKPDAVRMFTGTPDTKPHMRLARRMEDILARADPSDRDAIADTVTEFAERMVNILCESKENVIASVKQAGMNLNTHLRVFRTPGKTGYNILQNTPINYL